MNQPQKLRRGAVIGVSALAGLTAAALGVLGVNQHVDAADQQRDFTLTSAADAHEALVNAQVAQNDSLFQQNVIGLQESIYYYAQQNNLGDFLFVGDGSPPETNLFNGAFTRFEEGQVVGQALQQAQLDHFLGVNQTLGESGYESAIGPALVSDISGSGIAPDSTLAMDLEALSEASTAGSYDGFTSALSNLQSDLYQTAFSDLLGIFTLGSDTGTDTGTTAADLF